MANGDITPRRRRAMLMPGGTVSARIVQEGGVDPQAKADSVVKSILTPKVSANINAHVYKEFQQSHPYDTESYGTFRSKPGDDKAVAPTSKEIATKAGSSIPVALPDATTVTSKRDYHPYLHESGAVGRSHSEVRGSNRPK